MTSPAPVPGSPDFAVCLAEALRVFEETQPFSSDGRVVMACVGGSHSQNTAITDGVYAADIDLRGVIMPPSQYVLGLGKWEGFTHKGEVNGVSFEAKFHSMAKFVDLAMDGNPDAFEWMWLEPHLYLYQGRLWQSIVASRAHFSSRRVGKKLMGMARGQLDRMVKSGELRHKQEHAFRMLEETLVRFGISPEQARAGSFVPRLDTNLSPEYEKERRDELANIMGKYRQIYEEKMSRDPASTYVSTTQMGANRRAMVEAFDYDTKNACHMLRVLLMGREFLDTGVLKVFRTEDSVFLQDVKRGRFTLDECRARGEELLASTGVSMERSALPPEPDRERISALLEACYRQALEPVRAPSRGQ